MPPYPILMMILFILVSQKVTLVLTIPKILLFSKKWLRMTSWD